MSLLNTNPIDGLIKESAGEIQIFSNIVERMKNINKKIRFQIGKKVEIIDKAGAEKEILENLEINNTKFYTKLDKFLND